MPPLAIVMKAAQMPPLAHLSRFEVPFVCNPANERDQINTQLENQSAEDARPTACILSYTHTRPRKSRKECVIQTQVTQDGSAGELEYEGDSDKHSQEIKH